jgi:hypothetical protein
MKGQKKDSLICSSQDVSRRRNITIILERQLSRMFTSNCCTVRASSVPRLFSWSISISIASSNTSSSKPRSINFLRHCRMRVTTLHPSTCRQQLVCRQMKAKGPPSCFSTLHAMSQKFSHSVRLHLTIPWDCKESLLFPRLCQLAKCISQAHGVAKGQPSCFPPVSLRDVLCFHEVLDVPKDEAPKEAIPITPCPPDRIVACC